MLCPTDVPARTPVPHSPQIEASGLQNPGLVLAPNLRYLHQHIASERYVYHRRSLVVYSATRGSGMVDALLADPIASNPRGLPLAFPSSEEPIARPLPVLKRAELTAQGLHRAPLGGIVRQLSGAEGRGY